MGPMNGGSKAVWNSISEFVLFVFCFGYDIKNAC